MFFMFLLVKKAEWMTTTCNHALYAIVDVFTQYYDILQDILLSELYDQLHWCVQQDNEQLARSGTNCLENLVISNGAKFNTDVWNKTCTCMLDIFKSTIPASLLTWQPDVPDSPNSPGSKHDTIIENDMSISTEDVHTLANLTCFCHNSRENLMMQFLMGSNADARSLRRSNSNHSVQSTVSQDSREHKIPHSKVGSDHKLFQGLLIKCVVQLELIQTIDNILFFPTTSKKEDAENLAAAQTESGEASGIDFNQQKEDQGMYQYLDTTELFLLVDCLLESHKFAKAFNSNHEQRNILWKAGFRGKAKPNLLKQETQSLACLFRILFRMYNDETKRSTWKDIEDRLIEVCKDALDYFVSLQSDSHRESWNSLLILLLTRLMKMSDERVSIVSLCSKFGSRGGGVS
ncbi:hypothetical protein KUTeg_016274 [Tegillarca granosa]|uniref:Sec7/BIG1-like C-terminal domain-containing protein n=1 Tax=Tegillarca granosa TaxID=220873 RepID=A0ABQ9ELF0_TEGGR|nr:hypothetical protein KUTeg_016274 [Tegillarca granosa]